MITKTRAIRPSADPSSIVVPGLDTNAPINDQIDQIEQLITMKLQNIDANFSKIQSLMATRLLPAVKRYAVSTEPVREAAKFWTSFYERAAQVHIPTLEDYGSMNDEQSQSSVAHSDPESVSQSDTDPDITPSHTPSQTHTMTYDVTASESSFMPANAVSSTPARPAHPADRTTDEPSWSASFESPMSFAREAEEEASTTGSFAYEEESTIQGKSRTDSSGLHRDLLESNMQTSRVSRTALPTPRANLTGAHVSPLKVKPKTPIAIPKHLQPYLPVKSQPDPCTGVTPSPRKPSSTSLSTSALDIPSLTKHSSESEPQRQFTEFNESFDDSVDLMQGLSPPRTMAFARAPRSSIGLGLDLLPTLGRTPGREAADRIRRDLLGDMQNQFVSANSSGTNKRTPAFGYGTVTTKDDTMSTIPTPPSLSRYMRHAYPSRTDTNDTDTSLESMMRRWHCPTVTLELACSVFQCERMESHAPDPRASDVFHFQQDDQSAIQLDSHSHTNSDSDSDSDSLNDEPIHPGQPSSAFLMASSRDPGPDDSFGSSNSNHSNDSLGEEGFGGDDGAGVHPFARALEVAEGDGFDDSFDSVEDDGYVAHQGGDDEVEEETVFGIPPGQRQQGARSHGQLKLLGEDLLQDTIGIGSQLAKVGRIDESPTPFGKG
ncbi:hypothetical protein BU15DRAFT_85359 [Melanogaster broomeanus]|nr:hypothetical protein BU15DRAFT_85359 [Melanogaster broomeanus]